MFLFILQRPPPSGIVFIKAPRKPVVEGYKSDDESSYYSDDDPDAIWEDTDSDMNSDQDLLDESESEDDHKELESDQSDDPIDLVCSLIYRYLCMIMYCVRYLKLI